MHLPFLVCLTALALSAVFLAGPALGDVHPASQPPRRIASPAQSDLVDALVTSALHHGTPEPLDLIESLGAAGGHAAARGIARLLERASDATRSAALEAARHVGLREMRLAAAIRRVAQERTGDERIAAVEALGLVGDGRDMPLLLVIAGEGDPRSRAASFRAMRELTGTRVPPILARWAWHWKTVSRRAQASVPSAILAIEADPAAVEVQAHLEVLRKYGWADALLLEETVHAWLFAADQRLRRAACWLIAEHRLADFAEQVQRAHRHARGQALKDEIARAMTTLGVVIPARGHEVELAYRPPQVQFNTPAD